MDGFSWSFAVYLFCLVVGLGFAVVSGLLGGFLHLGGAEGAVDQAIGVDHDVSGHDFAVDHDVGADHGAGAGGDAVHLSPLSPPVFSTFLTGFGFFGMAAEKGLHLPWFLSAPFAAAISVGLALLVFVAVGKFMSSSQGSSHVRLSDLIGTEAEVTTPIPSMGLGEIAFDTPTGRMLCPARSETGAVIPKHSIVTITQVTGNIATVRETVDEQLRRLALDEQRETSSSSATDPQQTENG